MHRVQVRSQYASLAYACPYRERVAVFKVVGRIFFSFHSKLACQGTKACAWSRNSTASAQEWKELHRRPDGTVGWWSAVSRNQTDDLGLCYLN